MPHLRDAADGGSFPPGLQVRVAEIDLGAAKQAYANQEQNQWCWAASVQMAFDLRGYNVHQSRIVKESYGAIVNLPARTGFDIAKNLERKWVDDDGRAFRARITGLFDMDAGVAKLNNAAIIEALAGNRPLIIGTRSHAMVLTAIEYVVTPHGPYVMKVGVFDPWPGKGMRGLLPHEFIPISDGGSLRFLAAFDVR